MAFHVYDQTKILKHMGLGQRFNARRTDDDIAGYGFPGEREQTEAIGIYGDRAIGQFQRNAACRSYGQIIGNILWKPRPGGPGIHQESDFLLAGRVIDVGYCTAPGFLDTSFS
jgi:hypothetical protein